MGVTQLQYNRLSDYQYYVDPNAVSDHSNPALSGSLANYMTRIATAGVGGYIKLLPGTFPILGEMNQFSHGLTVEGCGPSTLLSFPTMTTDNCRMFSNLGNHDVHLKDFQILGASSLTNEAPYYACKEKAIYMEDAENCIFERISTYQIPHVPIYVNNCPSVQINDCHLTNVRYSGISTFGSPGARVFRNFVYRLPSAGDLINTPDNSGISMVGSSNSVISRNHVYSNSTVGYQIFLYSNYDSLVQRNWAGGAFGNSGNVLMGMTDCLDLTVVGNHLTNSNDTAMHCWRGGGHLYKNNIVKNAVVYAFYASGDIQPSNLHYVDNITTGTIGTNIFIGNPALNNHWAEWGVHIP
jgi:hypothetical protein